MNRIVTAIVAMPFAAAAHATAQRPVGPTPVRRQQARRNQDAQDLRPYLGKTIVSVRVVGAKSASENVVLAQMTARKGQKLSAQMISGDLAHLWRHFKLQMRAKVRPSGDGVEVFFTTIKEFFRYDRTVFRGLGHFTIAQVRNILELDGNERLDELTAKSLAEKLMDRYRDDGYAHVNIRLKTDQAASTITFLVDEGPRVRVRSLSFRGNKAFPARAFLGLAWNLVGSAGFKSTPGLFGDAVYSKKALEEDLDRLRRFYRGRGYKDAVVELYRLDFIDGFSGVEVGVRVFEGPLYRVDSVDVRQETFDGGDPLYSREELLEVLKLKPGDPVEEDVIERDRLSLSLFYGRRGFPSADQHRQLDPGSSFRVLEPVEIWDQERARVRIIYRVREGKRKKLRDVRIRGNRFTRDPVIRREISVFPEEFVNTEELARSQDRLLALQYFGDFEFGDQGVAMELVPVPGSPDLVDLDVAVTEGRTGQILWGVGVSSNAGLFGNIQYNKRNFDWRRPPTSLNPIDWFRQILNNEAFHGGGQTLNLDLAPGTEVSQASISFFEPDLFGTHLDIIGLGLEASRRLRRFETFDQDITGGRVRLVKRFGRDVSVGAALSDSRIRIDDISADAPGVVWDAEGRRTVRALELDFSFRDLDRLIRPAAGYRVRGFFRYSPEWLGSQARFWKTGLTTNVYLALHRDARNRPHVLEIRNSLHYGRGLGSDDSLYLTERLFMGGQGQVRGFDFRRAGPTQFGRPTGGEARYLGSLEYSFPMYSSRLQGQLEEAELLRGVVFMDGGMLGNSFGDSLFRELRLTTGFGLRIRVPGLGGLPIALDFAWPLLRETTDRLEVFSFTFRF